ncbi:LuxR C-terminal-related transcriptional regulator [Streptomyces sp. NPDC001381]|uniref:LuxR C-terminal-related transcriptional regulator n=1 Tax=Streptomyces sp. NPDC001381 TaxID=3364567 RepID=UPI0036985F8A
MAGLEEDGAEPTAPEADPQGDPYLRTRFAIPVRPATFLRRERLVRHLDEALRTPLTMVNGSAGAGKTLLVADWAAERVPSVAWFTTEAADQGPGMFWAYLLQALRASGVAPPAGVGSPADASRVTRTLLARLAADLSARERPVTVVLDEYDQVHDPDIAQQLEFVLHHAGGGLRLILVTRTEPLLPLHRYRAAGELTEIRGAELAFTPEETAELLALHGLRLPLPAAGALVERTRGWAAGLRLCALAAQENPDPETYLKEFEADRSTVADFLLAEVLKQQSPEVQDLLLRVSVLERLCPELANALTERADSEPILAGLHRENAFVEDLGHAWYRLHPLFGEILRAHLRVRAPGLEPELHRRAARWFGRSGFLPETLGHGAAAGDWEFTASALVDDLAIGRLFTGLHSDDLVDLFSRMGPEPRTPATDLVRAALALSRCDLEHGLIHLRRAERGLAEAARAATGVEAVAAAGVAGVADAVGVAGAAEMADAVGVAGVVEAAEAEGAAGAVGVGDRRPEGMGAGGAPGAGAGWVRTPAAPGTPAGVAGVRGRSPEGAGVGGSTDIGAVGRAEAADGSGGEVLGAAEEHVGAPEAAEEAAAGSGGVAAFGSAGAVVVVPESAAAQLSCALLEASVGRLTGAPGRAEAAVAEAERVRGHVPAHLLDRHPELTALLLTHVGSTRLWAGRFEEAAAALGAAADCPGGASTALLREDALGRLALIDWLNGRPGPAERRARAAMAETERFGLPRSAGSGVGLLVLAAVAVDRDELDEAQTFLEAAADSHPALRDPVMEAGRAIVTARLHLARGETGAAREAVERAVAAEAVSPWAAGQSALVASAAHLADGRPEAAVRLLREVPDEQPACAVEAARARLAAGEPAAAADLLDRARPEDRSGPAVTVRATLVRARAAEQTGDPAAARRLVARALREARRERLRRPFLEAGPWLRPLLTAAPLRELAQGWLTPAPPPPPAGEQPPAVVVEELSGRERDVLRRLALMMSTEDIAADLYLSVNTVKTHLKSAYRKLGVNRRHDAVRRARELGLL